MKIKAIRASGNPVDPEKMEARDAEWKEGFDEIVEKHGKYSPETNKALDEFESKLNSKYNDLTVVEIDLPKTGKAWKKLMSKYGNIMLTTCVESNEHAKSGDLLFVVYDLIN